MRTERWGILHESRAHRLEDPASDSARASLLEWLPREECGPPRRALDLGATKEEITQTVLMSMTIVGFPAMIATYGWIDELLSVRDK